LWAPAAFLLPYTLHSYYSPQAILVEQSPIGKSLLILLGVSALCLGFAVWRFQRRDIP
jgi:ABC-type transport system involved in multi-copper enzyme maturation permease subunit